MKHREVELYELYYLTERCDAKAAASHEIECEPTVRADADNASLEELEAASAIFDKLSGE
jgi:hypothetical protein